MSKEDQESPEFFQKLITETLPELDRQITQSIDSIFQVHCLPKLHQSIQLLSPLGKFFFFFFWKTGLNPI